MPANAGLIFNSLMEIAAFDAIPTDDIYKELFPSIDFGLPINENFETVGLESTYIVVNMGSLGIIMLFVYPLLYMTYYATSYCMCSKFIKRQRKTL